MLLVMHIKIQEQSCGTRSKNVAIKSLSDLAIVIQALLKFKAFQEWLLTLPHTLQCKYGLIIWQLVFGRHFDKRKLVRRFVHCNPYIGDRYSLIQQSVSKCTNQPNISMAIFG